MNQERDTTDRGPGEAVAALPLKSDPPRGGLTMEEMKKRLQGREAVNLSVSPAEVVRFARDNR